MSPKTDTATNDWARTRTRNRYRFVLRQPWRTESPATRRSFFRSILRLRARVRWLLRFILKTPESPARNVSLAAVPRVSAVLSLMWLFLPFSTVSGQQSSLKQETPPTLTFQVRHDHDPWGACRGELTFSDSGIVFESRKEEHSRDWAWNDVQTFDRLSERRFSILTWEDRKWALGVDREFDFRVLPGEEPLTEAAFDLVEANISRPLVDRLVEPLPAEYEVGVKHVHPFGGCRGRLLFTGDEVIFESENARHSRRWRIARDVHSFWSPDRYRLEVHVFEESHAGFEKVRRFRFQLETALDSDYYRKLRQHQLDQP